MTKAEIIVKTALSYKGSHEFDDMCQRFVRVCYEAAGIYATAASAKEAYEKWGTSVDMGNIPKGAVVYFEGLGSHGHVGIATGSGNVIHAANGIRVEGLEKCSKRYIFIGWGWHGGEALDGGSKEGTGDKDTEGSSNSKTESKTKTKTKTKTTSKGTKTKAIEELRTIDLSDHVQRSPSAMDSLTTGGVGYELLVENDRVYLPAIAGPITLEYRRSLAPGMLRFMALKDKELDFREGSPVRLRVEGKDVFRGYVFEKSRRERDIITVTAYDSLRYFKNKDTILYKNKTYSELLKMLLKDYQMEAGDIVDTAYVIEKRLDEGTVFDILANAADMTYVATGKEYVLLDDFGKVCLRQPEDMRLDTVLDERVTGSFDYTSTIDREVYNYVLAAYDNKKTGVREVYNIWDSNTALWGRLAYYLKLKEEMNAGQIRAAMEKYLKQYSRKRRYLTLRDVKGDIGVRGGSMLGVAMDLGDIVIDEEMTCERVVHSLYANQHLMDVYLYGREGEFNV